MSRPASLALIALAALLVGCTRTIDSSKASRTIAKAVAGRTGSTIRRVECPSGQTARKGAMFTCHVVAADGSAGAVTVTQTDDKGTVTVRAPFRSTDATERRMATRLTRHHRRAVGVDCPDLIPIRLHLRFECTTLSGGRRGVLRAVQLDPAGAVRYEEAARGHQTGSGRVGGRGSRPRTAHEQPREP